MEILFSAPVFVTFLLLSMMINHSSSDLAADRAECTDQLIGLATCLPYLQGQGQSPTPDCCTGFKEVTSKSVKCLCVLIRDRNNPDLGIKFNVSLALTLPSKCDAPTNVSTCIKLLNLRPNSADAKDFLQFEDAVEGKTNKNIVSANVTGRGMSSAQLSGGKRERLMRVEMLGAVWTLPMLLPLLLLEMLVFIQ